MKRENKSKGIAFAIDALFAIVVIAAFAITAVPANLAVQDAGDAAPKALAKLSVTTVRAMCLATVSELSANSTEIAALYSDGNLTANDSEMTLCQLMARLEAEGSGSVLRAQAIIAQTIGPTTPDTVGIAIYADGTPIYNSTAQPASPAAMHSSTTFVYSYGTSGIAAGPLGPVKIEARAWLP